MKLVIIGGTGLIGSKLVTKLRDHDHEAVPAAPNTGVNTLTGEGLADVMQGAAVVVDVSNSPSFEDAAVMEFFQTSTRNLLDAEAAAGVGHHVALSIVGDDALPDSGYMRAKVAQEALIRGSSIPYSIVHATQFFEFLGRIEWFPAHPHEGAVSAADEPRARVVARGRSTVSGRMFDLAVSLDGETAEDGRPMGRVVACSTFHHFADLNWDTDAGAPSFVTEAPGDEIKRDPSRLETFKDYVGNIARWLSPAGDGGRATGAAR